MDWNAMNPIEIYMVIVAAVGMLAAGTAGLYAAKKKEEAEAWRRKALYWKMRAGKE